MLLKVGDLAKRCGLSVRMLHHYDTIGLLTPSARSDSGYRLYDRADVARLHQIQALRRFGMSLADVGAFLANPDIPLTTIVERQIAMLDQQIMQASVLRDRLSRLHVQLVRKEEPELTEWLTTLEWMTMESGVGLFTYRPVAAPLTDVGVSQHQLVIIGRRICSGRDGVLRTDWGLAKVGSPEATKNYGAAASTSCYDRCFCNRVEGSTFSAIAMRSML